MRNHCLHRRLSSTLHSPPTFPHPFTMSIRLEMSLEISARPFSSIKSKVKMLHMRIRRTLKPGKVLQTPINRPYSETPSFWCSGLGVAENFDTWPGPPPYCSTCPSPHMAVLTLPLSDLDDQATWVREPVAGATFSHREDIDNTEV